MRVARLDGMTGGWFIGDFEPSLLRTRDVEVAVKHYRAGEWEPAHYHRVATEFTAVVSGEVEIDGTRCIAGDIVVIEPGDSVDFRAITDATTTVVKIPGAPGDKYLC